MLRKLNTLAFVALISVLATNVGCDDIDSMFGDGFRLGNFGQDLGDLEFNPARSAGSSNTTTSTHSHSEGSWTPWLLWP